MISIYIRIRIYNLQLFFVEWIVLDIALLLKEITHCAIPGLQAFHVIYPFQCSRMFKRQPGTVSLQRNHRLGRSKTIKILGKPAKRYGLLVVGCCLFNLEAKHWKSRQIPEIRSNSKRSSPRKSVQRSAAWWKAVGGLGGGMSLRVIQEFVIENTDIQC